MQTPGLLPSFSAQPVAATMACLLMVVVAFMVVYGIRHFIFTINRLVGAQRHP